MAKSSLLLKSDANLIKYDILIRDKPGHSFCIRRLMAMSCVGLGVKTT